MFNQKEEKGIALFTDKKYQQAVDCLAASKLKKINAAKAYFDDIVRTNVLHILLAYSYQQTGNIASADTHFADYTALTTDYYKDKATNIDSFEEVEEVLYDMGFYEALYETGQDIAIIQAWLSYLHKHKDTYLEKEIYKQTIAEELSRWGEFYGILFKNTPFVPLGIEVTLTQAKQKQAYKQSIDYFDKALTYHHNDGEVYYRKAQQLAKAVISKAITNYELGLQQNPHHAGALIELQKIYFDCSYCDHVIDYCNRYLQLAEQKEDYFLKTPAYLNYYRCSDYDIRYCYERLAGAYYEKGNVLLYEKEEYDEAEKYFTNCIALYPKLGTNYQYFEMPWVALADLYIFKTNYKKALKQAEKALQVNEESVKAWCVKGSSLAKLKKYKEALQCYKQALEYDEEDYFYPYYGKAAILAVTNGDQKEIYKLIKKVVTLEPDKKSVIKSDADFESLQDDPKFQKLLV